MLTKREWKAMAWGYGVTIPIAVAAIYVGADWLIVLPLSLLGYLITWVRLNL